MIRYWIPAAAVILCSCPLPAAEWISLFDGKTLAGWLYGLQVVCRGTRITTRVNSVPVADLDGAGILDDEAHRKHNVGLKGHLALQLHSKDDLYIQYKDLRLKPLE